MIESSLELWIQFSISFILKCIKIHCKQLSLLPVVKWWHSVAGFTLLYSLHLLKLCKVEKFCSKSLLRCSLQLIFSEYFQLTWLLWRTSSWTGLLYFHSIYYFPKPTIRIERPQEETLSSPTRAAAQTTSIWLN